MIMTSREAERLTEQERQMLQAYDRGEYTSLLAEVDQLSKRGPLSAAVLGLASRALLALERYDEAVTTAQAALQREPRWGWLCLALSRAEGGRGDWAKAAEAGRAAVQLAPGEPLYLTNLAECQRRGGAIEQAVQTARQALLLAPDAAEALNQLGLALEAAGDEEGALEQFRRAQELHPELADSYMHEGLLHRRAGRAKASRRAFQEALRRSPDPTEAENRLAESLSENRAVRGLVLHLLTLSRLTLVGWGIIAFLFYLVFRLLEFIWTNVAAMLPVGRALLILMAVWLLGGCLAGWAARKILRRLG